MSSAHQEEIVRDHFSTVSQRWGLRYDRPPERMSDLDLQLRRENVCHLLDTVQQRSGKLLRIIDVGCGCGNLFDGIHQEAVRLVGVDFVPEMLQAAARRHTRASFLAADGSRLPFAGGSADVITCLGVLEYVPDPDAVLLELRRVLRPGGDLIVSFPNKGSALRKLSKIEVSAEGAAVAVVNRLRGRPRATPTKRYAHRQWRAPGVRMLLAANGFHVQQMLFHTYGTWGRLGRLRPALDLSRRFSERFRNESWVSLRLAYTMVVHARSTEQGR